MTYAKAGKWVKTNPQLFSNFISFAFNKPMAETGRKGHFRYTRLIE